VHYVKSVEEFETNSSCYIVDKTTICFYQNTWKKEAQFFTEHFLNPWLI